MREDADPVRTATARPARAGRRPWRTLRRWALLALALAGTAPAAAAIHRVHDIRQRLLAADAARAAAALPGETPAFRADEPAVAQWFNWPNWTNWGNWANWNNWNNWLKWGKY